MKQVLAMLLAALAIAGCEEKQPRTVAEFMENEAALHGTLARCERADGAAQDAECANARRAAERLATIEERALTKAREQAFERARAEYRSQLDRERELRRRAEAAAAEARLDELTGGERPPASESATPEASTGIDAAAEPVEPQADAGDDSTD
jgi:hypothetical protein